jgi:hypothetical protein
VKYLLNIDILIDIKIINNISNIMMVLLVKHENSFLLMNKENHKDIIVIHKIKIIPLLTNINLNINNKNQASKLKNMQNKKYLSLKLLNKTLLKKNNPSKLINHLLDLVFLKLLLMFNHHLYLLDHYHHLPID